MNTHITGRDERTKIQTDARNIDIQICYGQTPCCPTEIVIDETTVTIALHITSNKQMANLCKTLSDALVEVSRVMAIKKD